VYELPWRKSVRCWPDMLRRIIAPLVLAIAPGAAVAQSALRGEVVWHWFGQCAGSDSMALDVKLDGQSIYNSVFPICKLRRGDIKPEPQQRILQFHFAAAPKRFRRHEAEDVQTIHASIWEANGQSEALKLGVSFATDKVLLNTNHVASATGSTLTERVPGLVIVTRPTRKRSKSPG
jgi:hypothetical protein